MADETKQSEETRDFTETLFLSGQRTVSLTYKQWMEMVNKACVRISGLDTESLADFESYALWDSCTLPYEAARECLENSDFPFEDEG